MAYENLGKLIALPAAADLSSSQYCFVTIDSNARVALAGDGADACGVLQDDPSALDRTAQVMVGTGITKVKTGGTVTKGGYMASDSSGRAVDAVSGDKILGEFLEASTGANQYVAALFQRGAASL